MKNFLIIGLESSCTKFVSTLLAVNLNVIDNPIKDWDGDMPIENKDYKIVHKSLPHSERDNFISLEYASSFDNIIICTRDFYCSLYSKNKIHQLDIEKAKSEHKQGSLVLKQIFDILKNKVEIFSYESAFLLGNIYIGQFLDRYNITNHKYLEILDINKKYLTQE